MVIICLKPVSTNSNSIILTKRQVTGSWKLFKHQKKNQVIERVKAGLKRQIYWRQITILIIDISQGSRFE